MQKLAIVNPGGCNMGKVLCFSHKNSTIQLILYVYIT